MNIHIYLSLQKFTCDFFLAAHFHKPLTRERFYQWSKAIYWPYFKFRRGLPTSINIMPFKAHFLWGFPFSHGVSHIKY